MQSNGYLFWRQLRITIVQWSTVWFSLMFSSLLPFFSASFSVDHFLVSLGSQSLDKIQAFNVIFYDISWQLHDTFFLVVLNLWLNLSHFWYLSFFQCSYFFFYWPKLLRNISGLKEILWNFKFGNKNPQVSICLLCFCMPKGNGIFFLRFLFSNYVITFLYY